MGLRLLIFDATCMGRDLRLPLSLAWDAGQALYRHLGRLDGALGASSWAEALDWLAAAEAPISEVQFWGHGRWGLALIGRDPLTRRALSPGHPLHPRLRAARERLAPDALWWFRTCETFGARPGHVFARAFTELMGCRAAGHTYVIGLWQSGLHGLLPGETPRWSPDEGLALGDGEHPKRALISTPWAPNTIHFLRGDIPTGCWFE